eukprot:TRINITY_DN15719_c0_g1_i1.p1 TRINITY_DN15719_c0_g1~~TRINITY_DN15719_c0_g1_i1.p1  ORF type:complete len:233 (-),score=33.19 TRINITY_DN15719_c0_g1_i1:12-710(-)
MYDPRRLQKPVQTGSRHLVTVENVANFNNEHTKGIENEDLSKAIELHVHRFLYSLEKDQRDQLSKSQMIGSHQKVVEWLKNSQQIRERPKFEIPEEYLKADLDPALFVQGMNYSQFMKKERSRDRGTTVNTGNEREVVLDGTTDGDTTGPSFPTTIENTNVTPTFTLTPTSTATPNLTSTLTSTSTSTPSPTPTQILIQPLTPTSGPTPTTTQISIPTQTPTSTQTLTPTLR